MAQIPLDGPTIASQRIQATPRQDNFAPAGAFDTGAGQIGQIGQEVVGLAVDSFAQAKRTREEADRVQALSSRADIINNLDLAQAQINNGIKTGEVDKVLGVSDWNEQSQKIIADSIEQVPESHRNLIQVDLKNTAKKMGLGVQQAVTTRDQMDIGAGLDTAQEAYQRMAVRDRPTAVRQFSDILDSQGPFAGLNPEQIGKRKQAFKEGTAYTLGDYSIEGAANSGDRKAIESSLASVQGQLGDEMDPLKRLQLLTKGNAYLAGWDQQAMRDADRLTRQQQVREDAAVKAVNEGIDFAAKGLVPSRQYINDLLTTTANTQQAGKAALVIKAMDDGQGFSRQPLADQRAMLERDASEAATPGQGSDPLQAKTYDLRRRQYEAATDAVAKNPWQAAQERGVIQDLPEIKTTDLSQVPAVLAQRMKDIGVVEQWAGQKVSPLQPQEADMLGGVISHLPIGSRASALAAIGDQIGDGDRIAAVARQMNDGKNKSLALALAYGSAKTPQGNFTAETILRGEQALKDKDVKPDSAAVSGWRAEIAAKIGTAYQDETVRSQIVDAAFFIRAGLEATGKDSSAKNAVDLATGGLYKQSSGAVIPKPYGISDDEFERRRERTIAPDYYDQTPDGMVYAGGTPMPLQSFIDQLPKATFVHAGQGKYAVRAGGGFVTNLNQRPIIVDLTKAR